MSDYMWLLVSISLSIAAYIVAMYAAALTLRFFYRHLGTPKTALSAISPPYSYLSVTETSAGWLACSGVLFALSIWRYVEIYGMPHYHFHDVLFVFILGSAVGVAYSLISLIEVLRSLHYDQKHFSTLA